MTSTVAERQREYLLTLVARAVDAGHEVRLEVRDRRAEFPKQGAAAIKYWAVCSCGYRSHVRATETTAVMAAVWHVGAVLPLSEADRAEARRVGVRLPVTVGARL